ncbi:MAG: DUF4123 domain-containing protein [Betaproteobacteria bacterium]|nr:DUF4123 domain-containing protein [Betaproteobacteria bacterium]
MRSDDTGAVEARLVDARRAGWPSARLYALLDPLLPAHEGLAPMLERGAGRVALFDQTVDAEVAEGGPWLVELDATNAELVSGLLALGRDPQGVVWLISERNPPDLAQALRERLNVRLRGIGVALLRYYDSTLLQGILALLSPSQRASFVAPAVQWLVERDGQVVQVAPEAPHA